MYCALARNSSEHAKDYRRREMKKNDLVTYNDLHGWMASGNENYLVLELDVSDFVSAFVLTHVGVFLIQNGRSGPGRSIGKLDDGF